MRGYATRTWQGRGEPSRCIPPLRQKAVSETNKRDWKKVNRRSRHQVNIRLSEAERTELEGIAARLNVSMAGYVKSTAFGRPIPRASRRPDAVSADLRQLLGLMGKLGSNANQIARACNLGSLDDYRIAKASLLQIQEELTQMRADLIRALGGEP